MPTIQPPPRTQTSSNVLDALFHEYEAVYRLAEFRLAALDRRIPLIGGVLTAFLSAVPVTELARADDDQPCPVVRGCVAGNREA